MSKRNGDDKPSLKVYRSKINCTAIIFFVLANIALSIITLIKNHNYLWPGVAIGTILCLVFVARLFDDPFYIHYSPDGITLQYYRKKREIKWSQIDKLGYESTGLGFSQFIIRLSDGRKIMFDGKIENNAREVIEAFEKYGKSHR